LTQIRVQKELILQGLRENLNTSLIEFAQDILSLPEDHPDRESMMSITFSEIFDMTSISTQDECLAEMIKPKNLAKIQNKGEGLKIKEIEEIVRCDRLLILKTLESLEMNGGMNGWRVTCKGERRGKRYCLEKI